MVLCVSPHLILPCLLAPGRLSLHPRPTPPPHALTTDGYHITELNYPVTSLTCLPSPIDIDALLPQCLGLDSIKYSAVTALLTAGGLIGSALSDRVVRAVGVAGGIAWTGWMNLAGAMLMAAAPHWIVLGIGR